MSPHLPANPGRREGVGETFREILLIIRDRNVFAQLGLVPTENSEIVRPFGGRVTRPRIAAPPPPCHPVGMDSHTPGASPSLSTAEAVAGAVAPFVRQHCHFYTHDALIDLMIARPGLFRHELAAHFGRTTVWLKTVMNADSFRAKYHARVGEMVDPLLQDEVKTRFDVMLNRSLEVLQQKLEKPADQVSEGLVLEAIKLGAKAGAVGGFGAGLAPPPAANDAEERLKRLHANLTGIGRQLAGEIVDVQVKEAAPTPPAAG